MTEDQIAAKLDEYRKQGGKAFDEKTSNPHPTNSVASYMHGWGWVIRDLEMALRKADPNGYGKNPPIIL